MLKTSFQNFSNDTGARTRNRQGSTISNPQEGKGLDKTLPGVGSITFKGKEINLDYVLLGISALFVGLLTINEVWKTV